ncbi:MAG: hypothetical protein HQ594_02525 [Candidatus Omnitrophica bacterium]|nr:hypothetical protein [Candidatus Omnitrophota bacterium]
MAQLDMFVASNAQRTIVGTIICNIDMNSYRREFERFWIFDAKHKKPAVNFQKDEQEV